jgi:hypothetical protein
MINKSVAKKDILNKLNELYHVACHAFRAAFWGVIWP